MSWKNTWDHESRNGKSSPPVPYRVSAWNGLPPRSNPANDVYIKEISNRNMALAISLNMVKIKSSEIRHLTIPSITDNPGNYEIHSHKRSTGRMWRPDFSKQNPLAEKPTVRNSDNLLTEEKLEEKSNTPIDLSFTKVHPVKSKICTYKMLPCHLMELESLVSPIQPRRVGTDSANILKEFLVLCE